VDLRRLFAIARRSFPFVAACVLIAGGAAFLFSNTLPKVYEANTTLIVGQSLSTVSPDYNQLLVSQRLSTTYASLAKTRPNLQAVITKLGLGETTDELGGSVHADTSLDSTLLTISAQDPDPARAAAIANAIAEQLVTASPTVQGREADFQASIEADLKATQDQIDSTEAQVATLRSLTERTPSQETDLRDLESGLVSLRSTYATLLSYASSNASNLLSVVEPAVAPSGPVSPRPLLNVLLAALLGLFVGAIVIAIREYLDDSIKTPDDVLESAGLATLGQIMRMSVDQGRNGMDRLAALLHPRSAATESYRMLRANIEFASFDAPMNTLLITSSSPLEGKTVTSMSFVTYGGQAWWDRVGKGTASGAPSIASISIAPPSVTGGSAQASSGQR
jgi:capsular polysaccharide biosynthesis protein